MRYLFLTVCLAFSCQLAAQEAVIFTKDSEIKLNPYLYYLIDSTGELTVDMIRKNTGEFRQAAKEDLRLGVTNAVAWLRIRIHNPYNRKEDAVINFRDPSLYHLTLYQINQVPLFSGTGVPQHKKNIKGNHNAFILSLFSGETRDVLIRVDSKNYMTLKAFVEDDERHFQRVGNEKIFLGFYYGILFLICAYSIILFFLSRFAYFFWYSIYIIVSALFTGLADGLTPQYLYFIPEWTGGYHGFYIALITNITGLIFLRAYFKPSEWAPALNLTINGTIIGMVIISLGTFIWNPDAGFAVLRPLGLLTLVLFLVTAAKGVRQHKSGSQFFLIAFSVYGFFILLFIANLFRLIPYVHLVQYSIHYGFLLSMVILSCALGVRIYRLYQDYLQREHDKQSIIRQKNEELEREVSERTASLATKESQLRSILDNSVNIIWLVNRDYELLEYNTAFDTSWQAAYGKALVRGKNLLDQYDDPSSEIWKQRYDRIFSGEVLRFTEDYTIQDETRHYEILGVPIRHEGEVALAAVFTTDITDRLNYEEQLKKQNINLQKVNEELDRFVYSASHDLKAPLSSLQGLIGLVKMETDDSLRDNYYVMMEKSIKRLDQFIRDIIDYSRNTRVELRPEQINITELLQSAYDDLHYMDQAKDFTLDVNIKEEATFYSDETRMRIVIRNLLSNALRYGYTEDGEKKIEISGSLNQEWLKLSFRDYGPGVDPEHQENIFKMFYRANETSEGTGLGLYIVRETLDKMNGSVMLETSGEGTIFRIAVPNQRPV